MAPLLGIATSDDPPAITLIDSAKLEEAEKLIDQAKENQQIGKYDEAIPLALRAVEILRCRRSKPSKLAAHK